MESTLPKTIPELVMKSKLASWHTLMKPHDIRLTQLSHLEWIHSKWFEEAVNQVLADVVTKSVRADFQISVIRALPDCMVTARSVFKDVRHNNHSSILD